MKRSLSLPGTPRHRHPHSAHEVVIPFGRVGGPGTHPSPRKTAEIVQVSFVGRMVRTDRTDERLIHSRVRRRREGLVSAREELRESLGGDLLVYLDQTVGATLR